MEKELVESCAGAIHSNVKYTFRKSALKEEKKTRNLIEMGQQNFGQSG